MSVTALSFALFVVCPWYPSRVMYYYVLKSLNLYRHSTLVFLSTWILYVMLCFITIIFLSRRLPRSRTSKTLDIFYRYLSSFLVVLLIAFSLEAGLALVLLSPLEKDMSVFTSGTQSTCKSNITCITEYVTEYIDSRLGWSWNNPMSALEIDNMLSPTDYWFLGILGFTRAHVILWQEWGSCGEHAIATAYLLHRLGYTVRTAYFGHIDHTWAEVYVNGTWYIIDPWYIGNVYKELNNGNKYLVPENTLSSLKNFSGSHIILCNYFNGTRTNCTIEHGYR